MVIMYLILMTTLFYKALILQGEIWCWSLLGLKGLRFFFYLPPHQWLPDHLEMDPTIPELQHGQLLPHPCWKKYTRKWIKCYNCHQKENIMMCKHALKLRDIIRSHMRTACKRRCKRESPFFHLPALQLTGAFSLWMASFATSERRSCSQG